MPFAKSAKKDEVLDETEVETRLYECAVLLPYPLSQKEDQDAQKEVEEIFSEAGAKQVAKDAWGRRGLAYPIKGFNEGSFIIYHYEIDPAQIKDIDHSLKIAHGILRHMLIIPPKGYQIANMSEEYEKWIKERKTESERREIEKEEELKRKVAAKAARQAKKAEEEKKAKPKPAVPEEGAIEEDKLAEELEKLISDDEIDI